MIVADTSAWIDYVRGIDAPHTNALDYELLHNRLITGDIIIAEFLERFREEKDKRNHRTGNRGIFSRSPNTTPQADQHGAVHRLTRPQPDSQFRPFFCDRGPKYPYLTTGRIFRKFSVFAR